MTDHPTKFSLNWIPVRFAPEHGVKIAIPEYMWEQPVCVVDIEREVYFQVKRPSAGPVRATDAEIKEELRNEIQASGDC